MTDNLSAFCKKPFLEAVTKFENLLFQNHRAFLIGAGCSKCAGLPLTAELTAQVLPSDELDITSKEILEAIKDLFNGARNAHIEDYLSELIDLLAIAERRSERGANQCSITLNGKSYTTAQLLDATKRIKKAIVCVIKKKISLKTHQDFVTAIHRPIRVGKASPDYLIDYLVLNYDDLTP